MIEASESERIQRRSLMVQALLRADGLEITDLLDTGVSVKTVASLYPLDMELLAKQVEGCLHTPAELTHFTNELRPFVASLNGILENMSTASINRLITDRAPFMGKKGVALIFGILTSAHASLGDRSADLEMVDFVLTFVDTLIISSRWGSTPEISGFGERVLKSLDALERAIPKRELVVG